MRKPKTIELGDCYEVHAKYLLRNPNSGIVLVHGVVTGSGGDVFGIEYCHCWLESEDGEFVVDLSNNRTIELPAVVYYAIGHIDKSKILRYSATDAEALMVEHGHYGPWELETPIGETKYRIANGL
ncbi:MAG: hypothetical protein BV459_01825 [Thermoplasmata archaeon M11B2D]|nr:MAG: hypothetical protein BV459_01825 [Thermoplasmata archaeon M11B2D]